MRDRDKCPERWLVHENYMRWFSQMDYLEKGLVSEYTSDDIYYGAGAYPKRGQSGSYSVGSVWTCDYRCTSCGNRCGGRCGTRARFVLYRPQPSIARTKTRPKKV